MAGRIFGARVFGPRVFGRVFGGTSTADTVIGWVNAQWFDRPSARAKLLPSLHVEQSNRLPWIQSSIVTAIRQFAAVGQNQRNQEYRLRARKPTPPQWGVWVGPQGWMQPAADAQTTRISGWRSGVNVRDLPPLSRRGVRYTVFDNGWITRNIPAVPLPNIAFWAGISPEKMGYPSRSRAKHPYLLYEYAPEGGWLFINAILPLILVGVSAFTSQSKQEYTLRARKGAPYMQEWNAQSGWITPTLIDILAASFSGVDALSKQEYTLSRRKGAPYIQEWSPQSGWVYNAVQDVVILTFGAIDGLTKQTYALPLRAKMQPHFYRWSTQEGWIFDAAFFDVLPMIASQSVQMGSRELRRTYDYSVLSEVAITVSRVPEPPEPGTEVRRITTLGSVTNTGA